MTSGPAQGWDAAAGGPEAADTSPDAAQPSPDDEVAVPARSSLLADAIGGPRGLIDSGLPAIVFVIVNATSGLSPAIVAALAAGVVLVVVRLIRREPIQQAISGFFGLGIAALVASRTHSAKGFFLPGILYQAALAVAAVVSLAIRRPIIGYAMAALDPRYARWRQEPKLLRAMDLATVIWGFVFLLRAVVQGILYLANHPGWLAAVKIAMGWPLFAAALALSYALARRAITHPPPATSDDSADDPADDLPASEQLTR